MEERLEEELLLLILILCLEENRGRRLAGLLGAAP